MKLFDWWGKIVTEEEENQMLHRIEEKIKTYEARQRRSLPSGPSSTSATSGS